jgi:hypothetical protein
VSTGSPYSRHGAPAPLVAAAGLTFVEGLVSIGYGLAEGASVSSGRVAMGLTTAAFFLAYGAALVACAWGLNRVRSWARGPVLFAQLLSLGLAWSFRGSDTWVIAVLLAVPALIVLAGLLHPQSMDALAGHDRPDA